MDSTHELIIPNSNLPFKLFEFEGKNGNYQRSRHWHRSIEIVAVFEGDLVFYINDKRYPVQAGEFIVVNSNEIHSIDSSRPNKSLVLQIPISLFQHHLTDDQFIYFFHVSERHDHELMWQIESIYNTYLEKQAGYEYKAQSMFFNVMYILVSKYQNHSVSQNMKIQNKGLNKLSLITSYMRDNWRSDLTLESTAEHFGYTATHLSKMFRKYAKTTYRSYLEEVRVGKAYEELLATEYSIGEIASRNGFPNSNAFTRAFKTYYGMLPSDFKKSHKASDH